MNTINAQTIINQVMAAHAIAPSEYTWGDFITFKTSARGTHRVLNCKENLQRFADLIRKNAAAFGGGLVREEKQKPAVSYPSKTISLYKQLIEDRDYFAALQLAEEKLSPLFTIDRGTAYMFVAPIPLEEEPRIVSLLGDCGEWTVAEPVSMRFNSWHKSRQKAEDAFFAAFNAKTQEQKDAFFAARERAKIDQSAARAKWMADHGIVDDAAIEARIDAQAAQDVAEIVAQAVAVSAIADAMAPSEESTPEIVTCEAGESEAQESSTGNASGFTPTHTPAVAVSGAIWGKKVGLNVIQAPTGKFIYVGSVPNDIGYIDGATPEQIANGLHFGGRFGPKTRAFDTEEDAIKFAESNGYTVENKQATPTTTPAVSSETPAPVVGTEAEQAPKMRTVYEDYGPSDLDLANQDVADRDAANLATEKTDIGAQPVEPATTPDDHAKFNIRAKSGAWFACVYMIGTVYGLRFEAKGIAPIAGEFTSHQERMAALEMMANALNTPPDGGLPIEPIEEPTEAPTPPVAECTPGAPVAVSSAKPEHDLKVGDVVRSSWGYDQTNVNHYQVTKLIGKRTVEVRELAEHQDATGHMSGRVAPVWGEFIGEPMRRTVDRHGQVNILREKFGRASKIEPVAIVHGVRCYASTGYSSYA